MRSLFVEMHWKGLLSTFMLRLFQAVSAEGTDHNSTTMISDFSQITPSAKLVWQPCFENFTCTRLLLPLDYDNASAGDAAIAFIKSAASKEGNDTKSVLINPGGPGGSGVELLLEKESTFRAILGSAYNIVGFDPRGVLYSEPNMDCFLGDRKLASNFANAQMYDVFSPNYNDIFELEGNFGKFCAKQLNESTRYVGTTAVARDMLAFTETQWQAKGNDPADAKVYYMGYSYGTVLGATFGTLFPDRVGRLLLDGVANAPDYYFNDWIKSVWSTDAAIGSFFSFCHTAGPTRCPFYNATAEDIQSRYRLLVDRLSNDPIAVSDKNVVEVPILATNSMLKFTLFNAAYQPQSSYYKVAQMLVDLENRNGTSLVAMSGLAPCYNCDASKLQWSSVADLIGTAISCTDADGRNTNPSKETWKQTKDDYISYSQYAGDYLAARTLTCRNWAFLPPPSQKFDGKIGANTSSPILILSNTIDPVTPLMNAQWTSLQFPGSALLVQDAVGHTTFSAPSECLWKYIRAYFDEGKLPPINTTCQPNTQPFLDEPARL